MGIIVFISIVGGLLAAGFIYFLVKILGKFKYYLLLVIVLLLSYWWFVYREMSIVEYYRTVDYYDNLSQEDVKNLDEMVRVFFVASYDGNERNFLDSLKSRICQDLSNYALEKHYTRVYKLPLFIGRNSHDNHFFGEDSQFAHTIWNASDSSKVILHKDYRSEKIELDCEWKANTLFQKILTKAIDWNHNIQTPDIHCSYIADRCKIGIMAVFISLTELSSQLGDSNKHS